MLFDTTNRSRRSIAALLAAGIVGTSVAGAAATSATAATQTRAVSLTAQRSATTQARVTSTVPASVTRAETAAEDVIGFLEKGQVAKSRSEARLLKQLVNGPAAADLRLAGVTSAQIRELQRRGDRVAQLSLSAATRLKISLAANNVSQLMPALYARFQDPVPASVLRLDYLDRQVQLASMAGNRSGVRAGVSSLATTWKQLRPAVVAVGAAPVAKQYDAHIKSLRTATSPRVIQKQAVHGLDIVDQIEKAFLA